MTASLADIARASREASAVHRWRVAPRGSDARTIEVVCTNLYDDPAVRGIVLNGHDVTERVRLEETLRHAQKMEAVGRLAGGVAHDFNNILAAIGGYASLIRYATQPDDGRYADAGEIELAVGRAAALTRQLLSFSSRQIVAPAVVDLNHVTENVERLYRCLLPFGIECRAVRAADLWPVHADPAQLEQVVMNLIINARDAMPGGGTIEIRTANEHVGPASTQPHPVAGLSPGDYVVLTVRDTGSGMSADVRARLFEPFFSTKPNGSGLGLSTVLGIVTQAGGHVGVESAPGEGSTFSIYLPRLYAQPAGAAESPVAAARACDERAAPPTVALPRAATVSEPPMVPRPARVRAGQGTVLAVDDERSVRGSICRILERGGYDVRTAAHGAEALEILAAMGGRVDVLVTDLTMPIMNGRALIHEVRSIYPHLPVVCMSGYTDDAALRDELATIADAVLAKPFTIDELLRVVDTVTPRRGAAA